MVNKIQIKSCNVQVLSFLVAVVFSRCHIEYSSNEKYLKIWEEKFYQSWKAAKKFQSSWLQADLKLEF